MAVITLTDIVASVASGTGRSALVDISCDGGTTTHVVVRRSTIHNQPRHVRRLIEMAGFELDDLGQGKPQKSSLGIQQHLMDQVAK